MSSPSPLFASLEPALKVLSQGKAWLASLNRPTRVLLVTTAVALALLGAYFGTRGSYEPYAVLFRSMGEDDASAVVAKLKELKVPYRLSPDGQTVEVPEAKIPETRLELAGAGLPRGGGIGFESFDKLRLGATEFEQRVLFRRALEGELSRTIGVIAAVQSARVHLVLPEKSVFVSRTEPASASIVVRLKPGRNLGRQEVSGIVHLASSSVPALSPDDITLVTSEGIPLHRPKKRGAGMGEEADEELPSQARLMEATLEDRARAILERVVGVGHADVRVTVDMDTARVERVEDHFEPARAALRSEENSVERGANAEGATGVPGAESNLPGPSGEGLPAAKGSPTVRESHTRNYELDHVHEKRVITNVVKRVTVAAVVDAARARGTGESSARTPEELESLSALVKSAVGASEARGDVVTVRSAAFLDMEPLEPPPPPPGWVPSPRVKVAVAAGVGVLFLLLVVAVTVARRRRARARKAAEVVPGVLEDAPALAPAGPESILPEAADPRLLAEERARLDPATAALIVRAWLGSPEAQEPRPMP